MVTSTLRPLLIAFTLALAACSGEKPEPPTSPATSSTPTETVTELTLEERGARIYKRCRACHTLKEGERHKVGPNLWGVYGTTAGTREGFAYSKAMIASEIVWDQQTMDAYLTRPADYVPGTKMSFIGLKNQEDRDAVQAFMQVETTP